MFLLIDGLGNDNSALNIYKNQLFHTLCQAIRYDINSLVANDLTF